VKEKLSFGCWDGYEISQLAVWI